MAGASQKSYVTIVCPHHSSIGLAWVKQWSHMTEGTLRHVVLFVFLRNRLKSILSMYQPTVIGVIAVQIDSGPANLTNSTLLSRTSGPCSQGPIELVFFNTESYGRQPVLEIVEYAGGLEAKANRTSRSLSISSLVHRRIAFTVGRYLLREKQT